MPNLEAMKLAHNLKTFQELKRKVLDQDYEPTEEEENAMMFSFLDMIEALVEVIIANELSNIST